MGILNAVIFYILVSVFARGKEQSARWKIFLIAIALALLQTGILEALPNLLGLLLSAVAGVGVAVLLLIYWCGIEKVPALKIAGAYFGGSLILSIAFSLAFRGAT